MATFRDVVFAYRSESMKWNLANRSPNWLRRWESKHLWAITEFEEVVGRKPLGAITREDALAFYHHWMAKVAPGEGRRTHKRDGRPFSVSAANRSLGILRALYTEHFNHFSQNRPNPFAGLSFKERKQGELRRPPFPTHWIVEKFLQPGPLAGMNSDARGIFLAMIETGAWESELCDLPPERIFLDQPIPYIGLGPSLDLERSVRPVPLVGVALAVFRAHPEGFPRYRDKASSLSATLNKYLRANELLPTRLHTVYSLRRSYRNRMGEAGFTGEDHRVLMGHTLDRPWECWDTHRGSLLWRQQKLMEMALPFDPSIV